MLRLKNKITLITGASRGIGKATALKFAREGAKVVVCDLDDAVAETVAEIRLRGGSATGFTVDVTKAQSLEAMISGMLTTYGRIDVLVNNAGLGRANWAGMASASMPSAPASSKLAS